MRLDSDDDRTRDNYAKSRRLATCRQRWLRGTQRSHNNLKAAQKNRTVAETQEENGEKKSPYVRVVW